MDLDPLALLWLMGTLHSHLNVFRRLTIPCGAPPVVRSFGLRAGRPFAIIPLPWRATASNHQQLIHISLGRPR
jgi:hypothetical protein